MSSLVFGFFFFFFILHDIYSDWDELKSHCRLDLYFLDD
jgi:hypothetical protein